MSTSLHTRTSTFRQPVDAAATSAANRRPALPRRAVIGGLLVAMATLATYTLARQSTTAPASLVVVAAHDLAPGTVLQSEDLRVERVHLDAGTRTHTSSDMRSVVGATVLGPVAGGELVQNGNLAQSSAPMVEMSFTMPTARALNGNLRAGETVDILATTKSDDRNTAQLVAADAVVRSGSTQKAGGLSSGQDLTLTVGLHNAAEAAAVASAVDNGQITLVRTTGISKK